MKIARIPMGSKLPNGYTYTVGANDEKYGEIYIDDVKGGLYTIEQRAGTLDQLEELFVVQRIFQDAKERGLN
ncbi:hypothetical protein GE107_00900 [Cohnella sp. CFH 77786]|uniref:hypothetical protein n=1 Tax=Cohnella sp. CFH 77786 TaxID=2662265 RepID=UPI001C60C8FE|nr:hypothetical protein [Cohnella sp. CFH 77786]MBW5444624.1 hypothetical protein [Cohnella sp. CFH 77786]